MASTLEFCYNSHFLQWPLFLGDAVCYHYRELSQYIPIRTIFLINISLLYLYIDIYCLVFMLCLFVLLGIVVEDCLLLILNLLKNNASNQNFFKEGSFVQRLPSYFELDPVDESPQGVWSAQKVTNIHLMLQVGDVTS